MSSKLSKWLFEHNRRTTRMELEFSAKNRDQLRSITLGNRVYGLPLPFMGLLQLRYEHDSSTIRARFSYNTLQHATRFFVRSHTSSSTPRESVVGVSCMLIDSSMHTIFTLYLYRPTLHRVCEYARNCFYKRN